MGALPVPVVTVITGEGCSGGALGIAVADRVLIMENGIYTVISPEGCAAILWRESAAAPTAARALRIDARSLLELGVVDGVVPEPPGGAETDHAEAGVAAARRDPRRTAPSSALLDPSRLVAMRRARFRRLRQAGPEPSTSSPAPRWRPWDPKEALRDARDRAGARRPRWPRRWTRFVVAHGSSSPTSATSRGCCGSGPETSSSRWSGRTSRTDRSPRLRPTPAPAALTANAAEGRADDSLAEVCAPTVGTFYRAPEPGAAPFVAEGDQVRRGQQVGIVEAMKLMIPIESEPTAVVAAIHVADGRPVEYGEPLLTLRPSSRIGR